MVIGKSKIDKGEISTFYRGKVMAIKRKDNKNMVHLTIVHNAEMKEICSKIGMKKKNRVAVIAYDDKMGKVDRIDQQLSSYPIIIKSSKKYHKKIAFHLLYAVWNSFVLYKKKGGKKIQSGKQNISS